MTAKRAAEASDAPVWNLWEAEQPETCGPSGAAQTYDDLKHPRCCILLLQALPISSHFIIFIPFPHSVHCLVTTFLITLSRWWLIPMMRHRGSETWTPFHQSFGAQAMFFWPTLSQLHAAGPLAADYPNSMCLAAFHRRAKAQEVLSPLSSTSYVLLCLRCDDQYSVLIHGQL